MSKRMERLKERAECLEQQIDILDLKVYRLENPFEFEKGEMVVYKDTPGTLRKGKILRRHWYDKKKIYHITPPDPKFSHYIDIEEKELTKLSDVKEQICEND
ncbi:MAG: hypothetical protein GY853_01365 [PVC group bacterium]|nr:hypothetical protein [PVC group bacterium]